MRAGIQRELRPMLAVAVPVILAELGWTTMGLVDTLMVGPLGPAAIGAAGLGSTILITIAVAGFGLLLGLDTFVSHAYGAGRLDRCHHWLIQGTYLGLMLAVPLTCVGFLVTWSLPAWGLDSQVTPLAQPYLGIVSLSLPLLFITAASRRYLQAITRVRPIAFALVSANLVNAAANWTLIYGHLGAPALGVAGAAWATVLSRLYMVAVLVGAVWLDDRDRPTKLAAAPRRLDLASQRRLLTLGMPAALQMCLELGVFAAVTLLAGRLSAAALASHQIALNIWSFVYMIPLGLNSAGAVRVGHAVGRRDADGVRRAGWTALALGLLFTTGAAAVLLGAGRWLVLLFSRDAAVLAIGPSLLAAAGLCLVFDGTQGIATGVLRGLGETRVPAVMNLVGHWGIGVPVAWMLCFRFGYGVVGLWAGLAIGLVLVGTALALVWHQRARTFVAS